eukprot:CAMPEP_0181195924 /NCGR_PEP_ID=MMETSP1096-20121128/15162_1 /TAXON_ID=156174 ORGANISM="Chrysochromulina ericina, Strain CCMP281" /NCGR_SAMPLE_ID=MMETSP1096 /ASSEMBLY_ACC=CAM_ASM_000453 /LENGTH=209 /DNA_ID=CAMNT_0023285591 /DNA_START=620 /DNA_END=1251 /DNA_ORIENTATION=+
MERRPVHRPYANATPTRTMKVIPCTLYSPMAANHAGASHGGGSDGGNGSAGGNAFDALNGAGTKSSSINTGAAGAMRRLTWAGGNGGDAGGVGGGGVDGGGGGSCGGDGGARGGTAGEGGRRGGSSGGNGKVLEVLVVASGGAKHEWVLDAWEALSHAHDDTLFGIQADGVDINATVSHHKVDVALVAVHLVLCIPHVVNHCQVPISGV